MPRRRVPLPPAALRSATVRDLDDDRYEQWMRRRAVAVLERSGVDPGAAVLELGCGAGELALGRRLEFGSVGRYIGVDRRDSHVEWCVTALGWADHDFVVGGVSPSSSMTRDAAGLGLLPPRDHDLVVVSHELLHLWSAQIPELIVPIARRMLAGALGPRPVLHLEAVGPDTVEVVRTALLAAGLDVVEVVRTALLAVGLDVDPAGADRGSSIVASVPPAAVGSGRRGVLDIARVVDERHIEVLERRLDQLLDERQRMIRRLAALQKRLKKDARLLVEAHEEIDRSARRLRRAHREVGEAERREAALGAMMERRSVRLALAVSRRLDRLRPDRVRRRGDAGPADSPAVARDRSPRPEPVPLPDAPTRTVEAVDLGGSPAGGDDSALPDLSRLVVYTALVGHVDDLVDVTPYSGSGARFVCFASGLPSSRRGWEVRPIQFYTGDRDRIVDFHLTRPHLLVPDRPVSLWVDASLTWGPSLLESAATCDHPMAVVPDQRSDSRVPDTRVIVRHHLDPDVVALGDAWWSQLERCGGSAALALDICLEPCAGLVGRLGDGLAAIGARPSGVAPAQDTPVKPSRLERSTWAIRPYTADPRHDDVDVVIPIHDALAVVQQCVRSVLDDPRRSGRLILVDDGSGDATRQWCEHLAAAIEDVELVRHDEARGFSAACNRGLELTRSSTVVVLNSDTIVPAGWAVKMLRRLHSHAGIGVLGPLSNAASWQSVPDVRAPDGSLAVNEIAAGLSVTELDRLLGELCEDVATPIVGMLNGFCLMLSRELLAAVGGFDAETFPHGYGEEVDLLMRAADAGFLAAVAPDTFVFHAKSRSFGATRRETLVERGRELVVDRHGRERLERAASSTREHPVLEFVRSTLRDLDGRSVGNPVIGGTR